MASKSLFKSIRGRLAPAATARNEAGGNAYAMSAEQMLAQYVATGCMNSTFYASAQDQLDTVLALCEKVSPEFIARTALYCRSKGHMKDLPALLCAVLSVRSPGLMAEVFDRVIDSPKMLRNFVQIMRSGVVGRKSLGTLPKRLVRSWLESRTDDALFFASVGNDPSLADIVKMVHPNPQTSSREALYGYLIGRDHDADALPDIVKQFEAFKSGATSNIPDVPFQMLTSLNLDTKAWKQIARNGSWQMTRMNLNTFARHGVLKDKDVVKVIANRLADEKQIMRARAFPYQLLVAHRMASKDVPDTIRHSLEIATEIATRNVPAIDGTTYVCIDVSGSMHSPVTGHRKGATSAVQCIDVAALIAATVLRKNPDATIVPFNDTVVAMRLNPRDTVMTNAAQLASAPWGGTNCSAPLVHLNKSRSHVDTLIYVSDNQSWVDTTPNSWRNGTRTMQEWNTLKQRCPKAKLVCIDLQPYGTTQAQDRNDILNIGGFSDAVFEVVSKFASQGADAKHWVDVINAVSI
ncbi:MAG: TROVE domain-containing protein [Phycisphaeraceae bacterium]|nr:TROVE domain-containing protein [Phycisphaerales bacterium]MCB9859210.1 TROVE domain-containing protein [Phycisphaeraceae bacterium]